MLLCIGDLLENVLVRVPRRIPRGETVSTRSARVRGGSAANVAALTAEQGDQVRFIGRVGDDAVGRTLVRDLRRRGVDAHVTRAGGTGLIVTLVGGGPRTRFVDRGASVRLDVIDPGVLDGVTQLYVPGESFMIDPLGTLVDRLVGEASTRKIAIVIGAMADSELEAYGADDFLARLRAVRPDAFVGNRSEHAALGTAAGDPAPGVGSTVITHGAEPTLVIDSSGDARSVAVPPVPRVSDRTGVGDGFIAGFLTARRRGAEPVAAVDAGHRLAAKVLGVLGPSSRSHR